MLRFIFAATGLVLLVACGSSVGSESATQGAGGSQSTGTTSSGEGGNPCFPDSCSAPSSNATGTGTGTGGGTGTVCGGLAGTKCSPDAYCDFAHDDCGGDDGTGLCTPKPQGCPDIYQPACGCDGMVYGNPCDANAAGVDASNSGGCEAPQGSFACGWTFCLLGSQYCQRVTDDTGGADGWSCLSLPAGCIGGNDPSCDCLADEPCGSICEAGPDGALVVTCPGG